MEEAASVDLRDELQLTAGHLRAKTFLAAVVLRSPRVYLAHRNLRDI